MAKRKKKNSNYQTESRERARAEAEREASRQAKRRVRKILLSILIPVLSVSLVVCGILSYTMGWFGFKVTHYATIIIEDYGTIVLELYGEEAPETVANFEKLANEGYYDGANFHRIIEDFMAQGGEGDGTASTIKGEFKENDFNNRIRHKRGTISMARADGLNSATSQFFIVHKTNENARALNGKYAAFGRIVDDGTGYAVLDKLCTTEYELGQNGMLVHEYEMPKILTISVKPVGAD